MSEPTPSGPAGGERGIPAALEERLQSLADQFLDRLQAGEAPDRRALLAEHPDIAPLLERRLAVVEQLHRLAAPSTASELPDNPQSAIRDPQSPRDDFQLLQVVGTGAFSEVFLARQLSLDRLVAVKVSSAGNQEGRTLASLEHDHIVQVFSESLDAERGQRWLCMQYVSGTTLERVIRKLAALGTHAWSGRAILDAIHTASSGPALSGPTGLRNEERLESLDFAEAVCRLGESLARALAYAHGRGVLHRDVKPANILLNRDGRPFLADFNLALDRSRVSRDDAQSFGGTLPYMSPEHLDAFNPTEPTSPETIDQRSDVYSLGVVLFELLTGRRPFPVHGRKPADGEALREMAAQRRGIPPSPRQWRPEVPDALARVVRRCLAPRPEERYQTADELAGALEGCRDVFRIARDMPPAGILTRATELRPLLMGFVLSLVPHVLGSLMSIGYNVLRVGGDLPEQEQAVVLWLTVAYTAVVFLVTVPLALWVVAPIGRGLRRLRDLPAVETAEAAALRQSALRLPLWGVPLSLIGWLPGGVVVPLLLGAVVGRLPPALALHFLLSFGTAGLMALPYNVYAMEFVVLRVVYPRLLSADPRDVRRTASAELRPQRRRLFFLQFLAGLIPLLSAGMMVAVGPEASSSQYLPFSLLVLGLIALGAVGFAAALLLNNQLHQTLTALTGRSGE